MSGHNFRSFVPSFALIVAVALVALAARPLAAQAGATPPGQVVPGIDVLIRAKFAPLAGLRVGFLTNHTSLTRDGRHGVDLMHESPDVNLVALFSPEHGIRGTADEKVASGVDEKTGLPIHSLYGQNRKPTPEMMAGIDVMVFDIQDIGTRFYTYIGTMSLAMQAAKENGKKFVVLDRPNPIGGHKVEGAVAKVSLAGGITAIHPIPTRHGMTVGELAQLFNAEYGIGCDLTVIPVENWRRDMYYDQTGLLWVNPSPNMKTLNGAILYPGCGTAEATTVSVGRGLDRPFEMYGAPYMDAATAVAQFANRNVPGVRFVPFNFTPTAMYHQFKDEACSGVFVILYDREALDSSLAGLHLVQAFAQAYPDKYQERGGYKTLLGDDTVFARLADGSVTPEQVIEEWRPALEEFKKTRAKYLLY